MHAAIYGALCIRWYGRKIFPEHTYAKKHWCTRDTPSHFVLSLCSQTIPPFTSNPPTRALMRQCTWPRPSSPPMVPAASPAMSRISPLTSTSSWFGTELTRSRWWNTEAGLLGQWSHHLLPPKGARPMVECLLSDSPRRGFSFSWLDPSRTSHPSGSPHVHARHRTEEPQVHRCPDEEAGIELLPHRVVAPGGR